MIPTNTGIQTALSGLQAYQAAIDTTGENIANANTPGYSRQRVVLGDSDPLTVQSISRNYGTGAQVGTGVSIDDISRIRDAFLDVQYRAQNANASYDSTMSSELNQVQTALGDSDNVGVANALSKFWSAWNSLANHPGDAGSEAAVASTAQTLTATLNAVDSQMKTVQSQAGDQLTALIQSGGQVDQDVQQIQSLNGQIKAAQAAGLTPNDLLDQRDEALDDLSSLGATSTTDDGSGGVSITFGGQTLLAADGTETLPTAAQIEANPSSFNGQLGALGSLADTSSAGAISKLTANLDTVATTVESTVNTALGGAPFFTGTDAGSIAVGATASTILASPTAQSAAAGLAAQPGGATDQSYATFVNNVGNAVQSAQNAATTSSALASAVNNQRQSVSGVSLDEEMANLITFQQGYQASARMMATMNDVIGTLINTVGGSGV